MNFSFIPCIGVILMVLASQAFAQLQVKVVPYKKSFLINQAVELQLQITNNSGGPITLRNTSSTPWLTFHVVRGSQTLPIAARVDHAPLTIPMGQTASRPINLGTAYALGVYGNYHVEASVHMTGTAGNAINSPRAFFNVDGGKTIWSQKAGIPNRPGEIREYKIVGFSGNRNLELFVDVFSTNRNEHITNIFLGSVLSFRNAGGVLDKGNNLHILYQVKPKFYGHACIAPDGKVVFARYIERNGSSLPHLSKQPDGTVIVRGGILYDPKAAKAERKKIHNASDRPTGLFTN